MGKYLLSKMSNSPYTHTHTHAFLCLGNVRKHLFIFQGPDSMAPPSGSRPGFLDRLLDFQPSIKPSPPLWVLPLQYQGLGLHPISCHHPQGAFLDFSHLFLLCLCLSFGDCPCVSLSSPLKTLPPTLSIQDPCTPVFSPPGLCAIRLLGPTVPPFSPLAIWGRIH